MNKVVWIVVLLVGCIEPYMPPEIKPAEAILVIDGHIDVNSTSSIILTRSQNLNENGETVKVTGATVVLENENGSTYSLSEEGNGIYTLSPQAIEPIKHRLVVKTNDKKEYASPFVEIKNSPPIDSLSWDITSESGVEVSVSTHNPEDDNGFYRWKYEETWIYTSPLWSTFQYDDAIKDVIYRTEDIYHCWQSQSSTDLFIASTSRLSENVISKFQLVNIDQRDPRLRYVYSILVKQYAITEEAHSYWKELKKTTEDLGTLFSPMPSQITGNFTCITNPEEKVLGYFSMGTSTEKRIFIDSKELPPPSSYNIPYIDCTLQTLPISEVPTFNSAAYVIISSVASGTTITAYLYSTIPCGDCRAGGGTNVKPDYWP
jgi:Domain of unknown function (DUF4249)